MILAWLDPVLRWLVAAAFAYGVVVAATHWAVRARHLQPFGPWPRFVRRVSDPVLRPVEQRVHRAGGNPQDASLWLLGGIVVAGLLLITVTRWLVAQWYGVVGLATAGPRAWIYAAVALAFNVVELAIIVRVIASWLGGSRYRRWLRPFYLLSDWIVEPLRRVLPPLGPFDMSPLVAYLLLSWLLEPIVLRLIAST